MNISLIAGARPNFIKIAPLIHAIERWNAKGKAIVSYRLIHTGQHFDQKMSDTFFEELNIPKPSINLNSSGDSQAKQTGSIMIGFEKELELNPADLVIVVGDVNSTLACSIVAKKMNVKVAHIEGGIRSFDLSMPEEINRMVTDSISDYFFTTSKTANENLMQSGIAQERIFFVGNIMIDTLYANSGKLKMPELFKQLRLKNKGYIVLTMHRPANVDESEKLTAFLDVLIKNSQGIPIIFPVHPRTAKALRKADFNGSNISFVEPMGYLEFNYLLKYSKAVITDSGGITEEATVLGVPCMTLRDNTERPETVEIGTNVLVGTKPENIIPFLNMLINDEWKKGSIPEMWDGQTSDRIVETLSGLLKL